jgi:hypothetical protein
VKKCHLYRLKPLVQPEVLPAILLDWRLSILLDWRL